MNVPAMQSNEEPPGILSGLLWKPNGELHRIALAVDNSPASSLTAR
jgi:hypothetical protein